MACIGGWLATAMGFSQVQGFIAAVVVAVFGSIIVRLDPQRHEQALRRGTTIDA